MKRICSQCNSPNYYAKGLCRNCYKKQLKPAKWSKKFDCCIMCGTKEIPHIGHGLCKKCYNNKKSNILCACGCGQVTTLYRGKPQKFIHGHWIRTQNEKNEFWIKSRKSVQGENNPCYGKFGKDHPAFKHHTTEETRQLRRKMRIEQLSKRKTSPTDIEIILSNLLDKINIKHYSQHPIKEKFVVDEFLPEYNTIIEAHGGYWHGDPRKYSKEKLSKLQISNIKRDNSKQKYLIKCEYKILILWEKDLKENIDWCEQEILNIIKN